MKSSVTPFAALGVGLAVVLTVGLSAISSVIEQPQIESSLNMDRQIAERQKELGTAAPEAPPTVATPSESLGADVESSSQFAQSTEAPAMEKAAGKQEEFVVEPPASPFAGLAVVMPYVAAAVVGSAVFVVVRKRAGW